MLMPLPYQQDIASMKHQSETPVFMDVFVYNLNYYVRQYCRDGHKCGYCLLEKHFKIVSTTVIWVLHHVVQGNTNKWHFVYTLQEQYLLHSAPFLIFITMFHFLSLSPSSCFMNSEDLKIIFTLLFTAAFFSCWFFIFIFLLLVAHISCRMFSAQHCQLCPVVFYLSHCWPSWHNHL